MDIIDEFNCKIFRKRSRECRNWTTDLRSTNLMPWAITPGAYLGEGALVLEHPTTSSFYSIFSAFFGSFLKNFGSFWKILIKSTLQHPAVLESWVRPWITPRRFTTLSASRGQGMSTMSLMKEDYWLEPVDAAAQRKTNGGAACCFELSLSFATNYGLFRNE